MNTSSPVVGVALVLLMGCGGSSTAERMSYGELFDEFDDIDVQFERDNLDQISDPTMLPTLGSATYDGVLGFDIPDNVGNDPTSLIGDMILIAAFQDDSFSGTVINFSDEENVEYDGTLRITEGDIGRTTAIADQFVFLGDIDGSLVDETNGVTTVDGRLGGDFYGDNLEFVAGVLRADITSPSGNFSIDGADSYFVGKQR